MHIKRPVAIDLFSGAGGFSLGIEASGFHIAASVDIDPIHCAVHKYNFPSTKTICSDLTNFDFDKNFQVLDSDVDLIIGGPPCQGFSQIGKRQLDDPRNLLVKEFFRIVEEIKPKYFIFENVPGILRGKHQRFVWELMEEFGKINYNVIEPRVLNTANYGSPQIRNRFIMFGARSGLDTPVYPHPTNVVNGSGLIELNSYVGSSVAIDDLVKHQAYTGDDYGIESELLDYSGYRSMYSFHDASCFGFCNKRSFVSNKVYGHVGSNHSDTSISRFALTTQGSTEPISRFYKLHRNHPCNTLRAGTASDRGAYTAPRPIHYAIPRCISVREAARLHTYPDWFVFHSTIWHGFREIGNSVLPQFAKVLGGEIMKCLKIHASSVEVIEHEVSDIALINMNMSKACSFFNVEQVIPARRRVNAK